MKVTVAHNNSDKMYVDNNNNIIAKNDEIITIILPIVRGSKTATIANTIGLHLGLQDGELHTFIYLYCLSIKSTTKYFGRSFVADCLTKQYHCSTRTINRYIDSLINKKIILYDVNKFTIKINPDYFIANNTETSKIINLVFAASDI